MRTGQETAEKHIPVQETGPHQTTRPGHLQDQSQTNGALTSANALSHRHWLIGLLIVLLDLAAIGGLIIAIVVTALSCGPRGPRRLAWLCSGAGRA
jgi:hypothetical protein